MSKLVVEVCRVLDVQPHSGADRLELLTIKGWQVIEKKGKFKKNDLVIYVPPDAVLPPELANSPFKVCKNKACVLFNKPQMAEKCECGGEITWKNDTPGRLGVMDYCSPLIFDPSTGQRTPGGRVKAARLRGLPSYGFVIEIDPTKGDNPHWKEGDDVADFFKITKFEPPVENKQGDAAKDHPFFHTYSDLQHIGNHPNVIALGEDVIVTEKIHGENNRYGLINIQKDAWQFMAGSHNVNRRKDSTISRTIRIQNGFWKRVFCVNRGYKVGNVFVENERKFRIVRVEHVNNEIFVEGEELNENGTVKIVESKYWYGMSDKMQDMMTHIQTNWDWFEQKKGIVVFGELFGTQDMTYGKKPGELEMRVFDIAVNGRYLSFDEMNELCSYFEIPVVPVIWRGPYSPEKIAELTSGPTTMCSPDVAGSFKGREGVVVCTAKERSVVGGCNRAKFKSVSVEYLDRKNGTDSH